MTISAIKTVGDLAVEIPGSTRIFERLGIDYCCGGGKSLEDACAPIGLSVEDVVRRLEEAERTGKETSAYKDWKSGTLSELISYIIAKHHVFDREELDRIEPLLAKVGSVHGANHPELLRIQGLFKTLKQDLLVHMLKEEQILFPYIIKLEEAVNNGNPAPIPFFGTARNPVKMMLLEHETVGDILKAVRELTSNFTVPEDVCISYKTLYQALEAFEADIHEHIHLENNILFPRALEME